MSENVIGQNIICGALGIGVIEEVTALQDGGEKFYKVTFPKQKCVNYISIKSQHNYRILSTEKVVNDAIDIFKSDFDIVEYGSIQEKIITQKDLLKGNDICKLAESLSTMNKEVDLHTEIQKSFKNSLNSFVEEIQFVLGVKESEVYSLLGIKQPVEKAKK